MRKNKEFCKFILFGLLSKSGTTSGIVTLSAEDMEVFQNKIMDELKFIKFLWYLHFLFAYYLITIKDTVK